VLEFRETASGRWVEGCWWCLGGGGRFPGQPDNGGTIATTIGVVLGAS